MKKNLLAIIFASFCAGSLSAQNIAWPEVTTEAKPGARWWWMGSAVDAANLTRNLEAYSKAGMGTMEVTPIYGVQGNDANEIQFLTPGWMQMLRHTESEAARLGMKIDMNTGTGWPFGGPADGFMGSGNFTHFDGVLAMYHDQGLAPFKALAMDEGVNYTAGLPVIRTSPAHGTAYDIAGKGLASEDSFRQAIYVAIDVFRNRLRDKAAHANPLRKQYYEKRDDSDKLKLDSVEEDL